MSAGASTANISSELTVLLEINASGVVASPQANATGARRRPLGNLGKEREGGLNCASVLCPRSSILQVAAKDISVSRTALNDQGTDAVHGSAQLRTVSLKSLNQRLEKSINTRGPPTSGSVFRPLQLK